MYLMYYVVIKQPKVSLTKPKVLTNQPRCGFDSSRPYPYIPSPGIRSRHWSCSRSNKSKHWIHIQFPTNQQTCNGEDWNRRQIDTEDWFCTHHAFGSSLQSKKLFDLRLAAFQNPAAGISLRLYLLVIPEIRQVPFTDKSSDSVLCLLYHF